MQVRDLLKSGVAQNLKPCGRAPGARAWETPARRPAVPCMPQLPVAME